MKFKNNKLTILFTGLIILGYWLLSTAAKPSDLGDKYSTSIYQFINTGYESFEEAIVDLNDAITARATKEELQEKYIRVQSHFRSIQFLLEYMNDEIVKQKINGPPLLSVEKHIPAVNVIDPKGLQVIDELLYQDEIDRVSLTQQVKYLVEDVSKLKPFLKINNLSEVDVKRAILIDIIRVYTLGVTGFDTPGSLSGIDNTRHSLKSINKLLKKIFFENPSALEVAEYCDNASNYCAKYNNFEAFDRAVFYKNYIKPILLALQEWEVNDLPLRHLEKNEAWSLNYDFGSLFSKEVFNKEYFTKLPLKTTDDPNIIALGKQLFYETHLSKSNTMSCATCHKPEIGFADGLERSITNKEGLTGLRNTPTLLNAYISKAYFYDLREINLSRQVLHVFNDKNEFNNDLMDVIASLSNDTKYKQAFQHAYPEFESSRAINKYSITSAIIAYVSSLVDFDSDFDQFMEGKITNIDPAVIRGYNLFAGKAACATCHFMPTFAGLVPPKFADSESEVLGIPYTWPSDTLNLDIDYGRYASGMPADRAEHLKHSFKTTTIRNIAQTSPYMHNGAFKSLEEVMDFYNKGGGEGLGIKVNHQTLSPDPLNLNENEIKDIITFMHSLTGKKTSY
jgi:cytochrome c peroxidase